MYIVLVEDDHNQGPWIEARLRESFRDARVLRIKTEYGFREHLKVLSGDPPDVVVMDVMLRWTDPSPTQPPRPEDVKAEGRFKAGLRCQNLLAGIPTCATVPVVLYTVLEEKDLRKDLTQLRGTFIHLRKDSDATQLVDSIKRLTAARSGRQEGKLHG